MNIGIFTNSYKPINDSGVVHAVDSLNFGLHELGHNVFIFAPSFPGYVDESPNVFRYPSFNLTGKVKYPIAFPFSAKISNIIKNLKLDIIHSQHPFSLGKKGAHFAEKYNIPLVFTNHTRYEDYSHYLPFNQTMAKKMIKYMQKKYLSNCDCVIAPTSSIKKYILSLNVDSRIEVIPNGINFDFLACGKEIDVKKKQDITGKMVLLYVGRLAKEKNISFLIKSFKALSKDREDTILLICGDGYEKTDLENLIAELGLQK